MGARNRVGIGLSYQATLAGGIDYLESIPGLLKSLKNSGSALFEPPPPPRCLGCKFSTLFCRYWIESPTKCQSKYWFPRLPWTPPLPSFLPHVSYFCYIQTIYFSGKRQRCLTAQNAAENILKWFPGTPANALVSILNSYMTPFPLPVVPGRFPFNSCNQDFPSSMKLRNSLTFIHKFFPLPPNLKNAFLWFVPHVVSRLFSSILLSGSLL
jgi:hypothetical protein